MPGIVTSIITSWSRNFSSCSRCVSPRAGYAGAELQKWTPSWSIEEMDKNGADVSMLSISTPGSWTGNVEQSRKLARTINNYKAQIVRDHPKRFGFFATIRPRCRWQPQRDRIRFRHPEGGRICLLTNYDGRYPGDPAFAPVYNELNRRKTVVYSHAAAAPCIFNLQPSVPPAILEFMFDNTRAIVSLCRPARHSLSRYQIHLLDCGAQFAGMAGRIAGWSRFRGQGAGGRYPGAKEAQLRYREHEQPIHLRRDDETRRGREEPDVRQRLSLGAMAATKDPLRGLGLSAEDLHNIRGQRAAHVARLGRRVARRLTALPTGEPLGTLAVDSRARLFENLLTKKQLGACQSWRIGQSNSCHPSGALPRSPELAKLVWAKRQRHAL